MLLITEFQKFMFIYNEVMKYGTPVEKGNWGYDIIELNGIKILGQTDNRLGMAIFSNDLCLACNTGKVEMFTYYVGREEQLDKLVAYLKQMKEEAYAVTFK